MRQVTRSKDDWTDKLISQDLKRVARNLVGRLWVVLRFEPRKMYKNITLYSDSDHTGCCVTRRNTTGIIVPMGKDRVKASSGLQSTIALSRVARACFMAWSKLRHLACKYRRC